MIRRLSVLLLAASSVGALRASPITYAGILQPGSTLTGSISQPNYGAYDPVGAVYYSFYALAGESVDIDGNRLDGPYDMAFWIFRGIFADTNMFGGSFDSNDPNFLIMGDDQDSANVPGPFGDPHVLFSAPGTGYYTVAVVNYASEGTPPYSFSLLANGVEAVPEPSTLLLFGTGAGLLGLGCLRRRR